mmetsp:Transcript_38965/g.59239  ORF Transcript_38965/g.59239 Transcript_38965/m.59239 type:complete len:93 (+) Transcript_38965:158-436(+)
MRAFSQDIAPSNKFRKIEKQTVLKLMSQVDKHRVKEVFTSLREFNRNLQRTNKAVQPQFAEAESGVVDVTEYMDDSVYLTIELDKNIEILNE